MTHITVDLDDNVLNELLRQAEQLNTSIESIVGRQIERLVERWSSDSEMGGNLEALRNYSAGKISRQEVLEYLGVRDETLTMMLNLAWPPHVQ